MPGAVLAKPARVREIGAFAANLMPLTLPLADTVGGLEFTERSEIKTRIWSHRKDRSQIHPEIV